MNRYPSHSCSTVVRPRSGVTISEVLISMVIMAVGVVSLATLFPISILRAMQASQLTNSAIVCKNARARLVYDGSIMSNATISFPNVASLDPTNAPVRGIVDPFGSLSLYGLPNNIAGVQRRSGGPVTLEHAESAALLPDSWSLVRQDTVAGGYSNGSFLVTLASPASNFADIAPRTLTGAGTSLPLYRMVLLDPTGRYAVRRTIREVVSGNQMSWQDPSGGPAYDLPSNFIPAKARIEVRDNRYTWLLTVRKRPMDSSLTSWKADADLVVFFNRTFVAADEGIDSASGNALHQMSTIGASGGFDGAPGIAGVDDDLDGTLDNASERGWPGSDDLRSLSIGTPAPLYLKKGGFIFEPSQARWYRVVDLDLTNGRVLLDKDLVDPPANPLDVVVMKSIVNVYELGTFTGSQ
ncbi:hypothetical protein [Schlesneria sp. T3-172]|uniref:type IV pilus modification PilV family protein n=1 Tax=Schlesneria sphaerica TaxID=3373610 RepID=UPI0037C504F0